MPQYVWREAQVEYMWIESGEADQLIEMTKRKLWSGCKSKIGTRFKIH
jgi:hypothetical protein